MRRRQRRICIATTSVQTLEFYVGLSNVLMKKDWNVTFLAGEDSNLFPKFYPFCNRVVHAKYLVRKPNLWEDLICLFFLLSFFLKNRYDVVYVASPKAGLLVNVAAFLTGNRVLYSIIGRAYETFRGRKRLFYVFLDRIACFCARKIVTISPSLREAVLLDRCCSPEKIVCTNIRPDREDKTVLFSPSRFSEQDRKTIRGNLGISEDTVVFLFVGRICRDKGIGELVRAFQEIEGEKVFLALVGADDDPRRELGSDVWDYINQSSKVAKIGFVDFSEIPRYLYASDVFVCPTYREALSGVGLEASLMELPVILTDAIGAKDSLIDGETGVMVPIKQVETLVDAMKLLLNEPVLRKKMGKRGRQFVLERFKRPSDEEIAEFFSEFLEEKRVQKS